MKNIYLALANFSCALSKIFCVYSTDVYRFATPTTTDMRVQTANGQMFCLLMLPLQSTDQS